MSGDFETAFAHAATLQLEGRLAEAVPLYQELARQRLTVNLALNLAACLVDLGRYAEAERWQLLGARHRAGDASARNQLGNIYAAAGKVDLAELEYRTAIALDPGFQRATLALAGLLLSVGRYAEGWPLMEVRVPLNPVEIPAVNAPYPEWRGQDLAGKAILVWYEQGLGDQIQMSRFAQLLKARGASRVTLGCRPPLVPLLATAPGVDAVIPVPRGGKVDVPAHDFWTRYFSLPEHLGITLENLPTAPYLSAPADRRGRWPGFQGKIGLAWQASPTGFNGRYKSLPPPVAQRLLDLGLVSLHPEDTGVADFADTAAIIEQLDMVVSIDTSVAHLAGAMGKPCWTLLPFLRTDWRWLRGRSDSPWYPTMKLYRLDAPDAWSGLVDQVIADLAVLRRA